MKRQNDSAEFAAIYLGILFDGAAMLLFFAAAVVFAGIWSGQI